MGNDDDDGESDKTGLLVCFVNCLMKIRFCDCCSSFCHWQTIAGKKWTQQQRRRRRRGARMTTIDFFQLLAWEDKTK